MNRRVLTIASIVLLTLVSLVLLWLGSRTFEDAIITTKLYYYEGSLALTTVDAVIIDRRNVASCQPCAIYRFSIDSPDQGSITFVNEDRIDGNRENLRIGDRVKIHYVTDRPYISEIIGTNPKIKRDYLISRFELPWIAYVGLGLLLLVIDLLAIGFSLRARRRLSSSA